MEMSDGEERSSNTDGRSEIDAEFLMSTSDFLSSLDDSNSNDSLMMNTLQDDLHSLRKDQQQQQDTKKEKFWFVQMYYYKEKTQEPLRMRINDEEQYKIQLSIDRCFGINDTGHRCPSFTCLVHPYCMECTKKYYRVQVSIEDNNRFRLYCIDPPNPNTSSIDMEPTFRQGNRIVPLFGEVLSKSTVAQRYFIFRNRDIRVDHLVHLHNSDFFIDPIRYRGPGFYARKSLKYNATIMNFEDHLWLVATKTIHHGEEILVESDSEIFTLDPLDNTSQQEVKDKHIHKKSESLDTPRKQDAKSSKSVVVMLNHVPV